MKNLSKLIVILVCVLAVLMPYEKSVCSASEEAEKEQLRIPIIMYHSILRSRTSDFVVTPEMLESDMQYILDSGYTTIFVQDIIDYVGGKTKLPQRPIVVTFDDGHYNNLVYALPIMQRLGLRATISVVGSYCEKSILEGESNPNYSYLTWEQIQTLQGSGHFDVQNHTYDMHKDKPRRGASRKKGESEAEYRQALTQDVSQLQKLLTDNCNITPNVFVYPFGKYSLSSTEVLKSLGFEAMLTCTEGINYIARGDYNKLFFLKRYNRSPRYSTKQFFTSKCKLIK